MIPIDDRARDGAFHLVEAADGTLHCVHWDGEAWAYSSTSRLEKPVARYSNRLASAGRQTPKAR